MKQMHVKSFTEEDSKTHWYKFPMRGTVGYELGVDAGFTSLCPFINGGCVNYFTCVASNEKCRNYYTVQ
jgi:hypothetical protein